MSKELCLLMQALTCTQIKHKIQLSMLEKNMQIGLDKYESKCICWVLSSNIRRSRKVPFRAHLIALLAPCGIFWSPCKRITPKKLICSIPCDCRYVVWLQHFLQKWLYSQVTSGIPLHVHNMKLALNAVKFMEGVHMKGFMPVTTISMPRALALFIAAATTIWQYVGARLVSEHTHKYE